MKPTKVPLRVKALWGCGGLADNFIFNPLLTLGVLIYVDFFRMSPMLAGVALFIPRFIDAITDPLIGNVSDNHRGAGGRRRPFILWGILSAAVILPLLWTPPGLSTIDDPWYSNYPFLYLCVMGSVLAIAYTLFVVPYTALGWELTEDYDERTSIVSWRMYIGLAGSLTVAWLYRMAHWEIFPDEGVGVFFLAIVLSLIVLVFGLAPYFGCKGWDKSSVAATKIKIFSALGYTFKNKAFRVLMGAYFFIVMGLFSSGGVVNFILIHHVFEGDKAMAASYAGIMGTIMVGMSYVSIVFISWISRKRSKRDAMIVGLVFGVLGTLINWYGLDPRWPWVLFVGSVVQFLGLQGCWLMVDSMMADVCDVDELNTGRRGEGIYSAARGFMLKVTLSITALSASAMMAAVGYDSNAVNEVGMAASDAAILKTLAMGSAALGLSIAVGLMLVFPISREDAQATRQALDARREIS